MSETTTPEKRDPLYELLKANPNCRVTISFGPRRKKAKNPRPKPNEGDIRQRGWNIYRWDFQRSDGATVVGPRGARRWSWYFERQATPEEYKAWRLAQKEAKIARAAAKAEADRKAAEKAEAASQPKPS